MVFDSTESELVLCYSQWALPSVTCTLCTICAAKIPFLNPLDWFFNDVQLLSNLASCTSLRLWWDPLTVERFLYRIPKSVMAELAQPLLSPRSH